MKLFARMTALALVAVLLLATAGLASGKQAALEPKKVQAAIDAAYAKYKGLKEGKNADYIPALAKVDTNLYGIALLTVDGKLYVKGDIKTQVSIQSISKVLTLARVIQDVDRKIVEDTVGVDATGMVFNSIEAIERYKGQEMNPLVNPGAITLTSMVKGDSPRPSGPRSWAPTAISPAASSRCWRMSTNPRRPPTSATRPSPC